MSPISIINFSNPYLVTFPQFGNLVSGVMCVVFYTQQNMKDFILESLPLNI